MRSLGKNGSVLVVTLGFILVFTLLGVSSFHHAGSENDAAEKRKLSMAAFWLADAGVERAKNKLMKTPPVMMPAANASESLGQGEYDVFSIVDPGCTVCTERWRVHSQGIVGNQKRTIEAIVAEHDITDVLTTEGPIKNFDDCPMGSVLVDCDLVKENKDISLESIIGASKADLMGAATHTYINPANAEDVNPIEGITVIYLTENNHSLNITTDNQTSPAFVLIDTTQVTAHPTPNITIAGTGDFIGVIWIIGNAHFEGDTAISGAVFVECGSTSQTQLLGNTTLNYDANAIDAVIEMVGGEIGGSSQAGVPHLISYQEL